MKRWPVVMLALLLAKPAWGTPQVSVYPLQHRSADALLHVLQPLLPAAIRASTDGSRLLLQGEGADGYGALIQQLDVPPRTLRVTLENRTSPRPAGNSRQYGSDPGTQDQINVQEGQRATLDLGQVVNRQQLQQDGHGRYQVVPTQTQLPQQLNVTAWVLPEQQVRVQVSVLDRRAGHAADDYLQLDSTTQGALGQWLLLGGRLSRRQAADATRHYSTQTDAQYLYIRVDALEPTR